MGSDRGEVVVYIIRPRRESSPPLSKRRETLRDGLALVAWHLPPQDPWCMPRLTSSPRCDVERRKTLLLLLLLLLTGNNTGKNHGRMACGWWCGSTGVRT